MKSDVDIYDYIIVGAGSAGCILANRLSSCGKYSVCVLEAGPKDWHPMLYIPAGFIKTLVNPRFNWMYSSEPSAGTNGRPIPAPRVKCLVDRAQSTVWVSTEVKKWTSMSGRKRAIQAGPTMTFCPIFVGLRLINPMMTNPIAVQKVK